MSCSAFWCIWVVKSRHYFLGSGGPGMSPTKSTHWTCYAEDVFLHLVGSVSHVGHSGVFESQNAIVLPGALQVRKQF
jgi:hypothetical protein